MAALFALATSGDPLAGQVLASARQTSPPFVGDEATWNILHFARRRLESGRPYSELSTSARRSSRSVDRPTKATYARLRSMLVEANGPGALDSLLATMVDRNKHCVLLHLAWRRGFRAKPQPPGGLA